MLWSPSKDIFSKLYNFDKHLEMGGRVLHDDSDEFAAVDADDDELVASSRAYQLEMFEESLKRNIIVAMDTGTGKTRVAILRIRAELERSPPPKIVWFLAPTVFLCDQQFTAILQGIPGAQAKIITGQSGVDAWSTQEVWDAVLLNVRVVVATHQILLDAMHHGFVKMRSISLLIFDEVHGCVKEHAGKRIMKEFYEPARERGEELPAILGMTASPVQGTKMAGLEKLEQTMHAICRTPTRHREELVAHTKQPKTFRHFCTTSSASWVGVAPNVLRLDAFYEQRHLQPFTAVCSDDGGPASEKDYDKAWSYVRALLRRSTTIYEELGAWAAEYYVYKVIRRCAKTARQERFTPNDRRMYLQSLLQQIRVERPARPGEPGADEQRFLGCLSSKVQTLAEILMASESTTTAAAAAARTTGIVFVKERPMAAVLARVLSLHPRLRQRFQAGHVVGMSQLFSDAYDAALVLNPRDSSLALRRFRQRQINLLVATSVIEEGIDVPACNLVVCIDELTSLKAFIQRRGRAREDGSQLHLLLTEENQKRGALVREWEELEHEMKRRYEDDLRAVGHIDKKADDDGRGLDDEQLLPPMLVPATQARIRARDAKMHLEHFCATSTKSHFVDWQPVYILHEYAAGEVQDEEDEEEEDEDIHTFGSRGGPLRATVQLPITLPAHLRRAHSLYAWRREEHAYADAAFQAYKQLYQDGLLTDHLLPPKAVRDSDLLDRSVEGRPGVVAAQVCWRPWDDVAREWAEIDDACRRGQPAWVLKHSLRLLDSTGSELCHADLVLPAPASTATSWALPPMKHPVDMYWSPQSQRPWTMHIGPARRERATLDLVDHTTVLLSAAYGHRWPVTHFRDHLVRLVCVDEPHLSVAQLGALAFTPDLFADKPLPLSPHTSSLVRGPDNAPYVYEGYAETKPPVHKLQKAQKGYEEEPEDVPYALVRPLPKQPGSLHRQEMPTDTEKTEGQKSRFSRALQASTCRVDTLPTAYVQFGALIPPLMPVLEVHMVTARLLSTTALRQLPVQDRTLFATAISAPAARLPDNYEYLEFLGDSILKLLASTGCAARHLDTPEGHLSLLKDRRVANARLCRAALDFGLDRFIVSEQWSLREWRRLGERLTAEAEAQETGEAEDETKTPKLRKRSRENFEMSTKMLADVVEALIGASMLDGGLDEALQCIEVLLPEDEPWMALETSRAILWAAAPVEAPWHVPAALEEMLGYAFRRPSLLAEAMTHASVPSLETGACMERLEFLGDALLDHVIVQEILAYQRRAKQAPIDYQTLHMLRSALSNAGILGFVAMEMTIAEPSSELGVDEHTGRPLVQLGEILQPLWAFMRHGVSPEMVAMQRAARVRHLAVREELLQALWTDTRYPWALLARLRPEKVFSDVVEAVLGAIWVDCGSMAALAALLEKLGLLPYMRRALDDGVQLLHPKTELGRRTGSAIIRYDVRSGPAGDQTHPPTATAREEDEEEDDSDSDSDSDSDEAEPNASGPTLYSCRLLINDECEVEVVEAWSRDEAECRAADIFVRELLPAWQKRQTEESDGDD